MEIEEDMVCYVVAQVLETRQQELAIIERDINRLEAITLALRPHQLR